MRLIDGDELKTAFPCGEYVRTESVRATIDSMPTIDAEPVRHAKIVNIPFGDSTYEGCSLCGADYDRYYSHGKYCSYCGAKMDGETT